MGGFSKTITPASRQVITCLLIVLMSVSQLLAFSPLHNQKHLSSFTLNAKKTLTEETNWRLRFALNGIPTEQGKKLDELFVVEAQFIEDGGYEPPQGSLKQIFREDISDGTRMLKIQKSRWVLSEDPDERKDGLWVWGLFAEPLYPFLLLTLETSRIPVPGCEGDYIKPLKLFAKIDHKRDSEVGASLSGAELKVREIETIKADPFGAATVDVYEENTIGQISILAL